MSRPSEPLPTSGIPEGAGQMQLVSVAAEIQTILRGDVDNSNLAPGTARENLTGTTISGAELAPGGGLPYSHSYGVAMTATLSPNTWVNYVTAGANVDVPLTGRVGDIFRVFTSNYHFAPGNTGFNRNRWGVAVGGATVVSEGSGGYYTVDAPAAPPVEAIVVLTTASATMRLQTFSNTSGTSSILAGVGGAGNTAFVVMAYRLGPQS